MSTFLFFDTETSALPLWKEPSEDPRQPHLVELFAMLVDEDSGEVIDSLHALVRPDDWVISEEVSAIHGITHERALAEGRPEADVLADFLALHARAVKRVAHNESFDARILRIAIKRYRDDELADSFKAFPAFCTMQATTPICQIPGKFKGSYKWPKLAEAFKHFTGEDLVGAHSAKADTEACATVYFALQGRTVRFGAPAVEQVAA